MKKIDQLKDKLQVERERIIKDSFVSNVEEFLNPQKIDRYELLEWYFQQPLLKELVEGEKMESYKKFKTVPAFDGLLKQLFPSVIFQWKFIDYQWHCTLRRLEVAYPIEFQQFLKKLQMYEKYILMIRKNAESYNSYFQQEQKKIQQQFDKSKAEAKYQIETLRTLKSDNEKQLRTVETLKELVEGKVWLTNNKIKSLLKIVELDHAVKNDFSELMKYIHELIDFPIVHDLINMSTQKTSIPLWFAIVGATCRLNDKYSFQEGFTEAEIAQMELTLNAFDEYDRYQQLYTGEWDSSLEVTSFVSYFSKNPNLLVKIATDFTDFQQVMAFKQLMSIDENTIFECLKKEPSYIPHLETILKNVVADGDDQLIGKLRVMFTSVPTREFIENQILKKKSYVWLILIEPKSLFDKLKGKYPENQQLQRFKEDLVYLLKLDWSNLQKVGQEAYSQYWEFIFNNYDKFRKVILSNPFYIVQYDRAKGNSQEVWNWLKETVFEDNSFLKAKPIVGLDHVLRKIGTTEQVNNVMTKWIDDYANFDILRNMGFTIVTGAEDSFVSASTVLQSSMLFELEDEMLTDPFENYKFEVKRVGVASPDGTILRRTKIKAQLIKNDEENLDDWLSNLENL